MDQKTALNKLRKYCAYQDRCHSEVRFKLLDLKVYGHELEEIMTVLIEEKYLDELRYAKSFTRGRFNYKQWGRNKIRTELIRKQISEYCIRVGLREIDDNDYLKTIATLAEKKFLSLKSDLQRFEKYRKVYAYLINKGFEIDLVKKAVDQTIQDVED